MAFPIDGCVDCGKKITKGAIRCKTCSNKSRKKFDIKATTKREYDKIYRKKFWVNKKECNNRYARKRRRRLREEITKLLGGKCKCGYYGLALEIHHVNGGGTAQRKRQHGGVKGGDNQYLRNILKRIKAGSKEFQLLCANCHKEKDMISRRYQP